MIDWNEIANADMPTERGSFMRPGRYKAQVGSCIFKTLRKDRSPALIVEMTILESDNGEHQIGDRVTWLQKLNNDAAPSAVKAFLVAVAGIAAKDRDAIDAFAPKIPTIMAALEKDPEALAKKNRTVSLECKQITTKAGEPFTLHVFDAWTPPAGWTPGPCPPRTGASAARAEQANARSVASELAGDTEIPF